MAVKLQCRVSWKVRLAAEDNDEVLGREGFSAKGVTCAGLGI